MNEPTTDEALLRQVLSRDPAAWRVIRERHEAYLFSVARSFAGVDADDVVQTAWLRLLESGDAIRNPQRLRAWLACVVRRESLAQLRRRRRVTGDPDCLNAVPCSEASPEETVMWHETEHLLRDAMTDLSDRHAILLRLLTASGLDYQSIGQNLALPIGSIGPTRARALRHLAKALACRGVNADLAFAV